jgi:pimeloyl-ACP methyl ester carboxylesterase
LSTTTSPAIYLLPGMGADRSLYPPPWDTLPHVHALDWPSYQGETTLADVARRLITEHNIRDGCVLIGTSLGGMVACEIAKLVRVRSLILISSATSRDELGALLASVRPLIDLTPLALVRWLAAFVPTEVAQMFHRSDPNFIRAMCRAIFTWEGIAPETKPVHRIHGRTDRVIPPPPHVDHLIDGGHLITLTHAAECVACVRRLLDLECES